MPLEVLDDQAGDNDYSAALRDWAERLLECDDPLTEMNTAVDDLGVFLQELREVRDNYSRLRDYRAHDDDGPKGYTPRPADWPGSSESSGNITPNEASKCHVAGSMTKPLDPSLRALISGAAQSKSAPTGIIPFAEVDDRDQAVHDVAHMIDSALTGTAIHVFDLAGKIVDRVLGYD